MEPGGRADAGRAGTGPFFGVQVAGIRRGGVRILSPGADERLQAGDEVLVLGAPGQLRAFMAWLQAEPEDGLAAD